ncbi:hypothetical protein I302_108630 [Kwoniella bestiolae CBS 10118]|uniref:TatD DNase n=1 Tax=Kwoniella bestiolae CBS 10118 TaxID=1296100 RepID=A0A1B9FTM5_9TREE|nr:hypothetical protein I302_07767 [Kwoniella bestiolae CBS 10118]OCF22125.1 hypothetical protein I302_07767 [Kwoniella bestiolae CBS 10118]
MCTQHDDPSSSTSSSQPRSTNDKKDQVEIPDWENIQLPPDHVLSHLTDAHCHPTDLTHKPEVYDQVKLGGLASMATIVGDQDKVRALSEERGWYDTKQKGKGKEGKGVGVIACFGYHPWFTHLYTLSDPSSHPSKEDHYFSLFSPKSQNHKDLLSQLIPFLPDPIPFEPLLQKSREDIQRSIEQGRMTMLGEVGLDGSARMRWPKAARHLHPDYKHDEDHQQKDDDEKSDDQEGKQEEEEWKRLTPFKVPMSHQRALLDRQLDLAVELGVNVSFHSVACAGPSLETLISMRDRHGIKFTNGINVDVHSAGGWSPDSWKQAERNLLNLYASPSIFITGRSPHASSLISTISKDRLLVESDSHDVRLSDRLVWAATEWIARCKGWKLEGRDTPDGVAEWSIEDYGDEEDEEEEFDEKGRLKKNKDEGRDIWTVMTLERNWLRFMRCGNA